MSSTPITLNSDSSFGALSREQPGVITLDLWPQDVAAIAAAMTDRCKSVQAEFEFAGLIDDLIQEGGLVDLERWADILEASARRLREAAEDEEDEHDEGGGD